MQSYYQIQQALDTNLLDEVAGVSLWAANNTSGNFFTENQPLATQYNNNLGTGVLLRSTLVPITPVNKTIGVDGYDELAGFYNVDVMGLRDKGYAYVKQMADSVIAAFPRGTILALATAGQITIEKSGIGVDIAQGGWKMDNLYCVRVRVDWFGYFAP